MSSSAGAGGAVVAVVPASMSSKRLPGKMLLDETGIPLVVHTWRRVAACDSVDRVLVATSSPEIRRAVESEGGEVFDTPADVATGSDRVAAVASEVEGRWFLNVQGDEPTIDPGYLDRIAAALRGGDDFVTVAEPIADRMEWSDPNTVKVVFDAVGRALYFSRSAVPHEREGTRVAIEHLGHKHVGVYGFSRERLLEFARSERGRLEMREGLEQLRALELGWTIRVLEGTGNTRGINTREDYDWFVGQWRERAVEGVEDA